MTDGRRKQKEITGPTKRSVERLLAQKVKETEHRKVHYEISLGEWLDLWLKESARGNTHTIGNYTRAAKEAKQLLGKHPLEEVTAPMIDRALEGASTKRNAQEILKVLRLAFKEAQRERRIPDNPASLARPIRLDATRRKSVFTPEKMQKVLAATENDVYRAFFAFLWATGARPWSEAAPLEWDELLRDDDGFYFHGAKTAKGREPRPIPNWIMPHLMALGGENQLFPGNMDQSKVAKAWAKALKDAGLEHAPIKDLRSTFATLHAEGGKPIAVVSALMGHTDTKTTETFYAKIRRSEMRKHVE